jgi:hypothetical protein
VVEIAYFTMLIRKVPKHQERRMNFRRTHCQSILMLIVAGSMLLSALTGCQINFLATQTPNITPSYPLPPTATPQPMAEIFFAVTLPSPLQAGESLYLSILDEVTGLALNPVNYTMQAGDDLHYYVALPLVVNSVVKYRYVRQGNIQIFEDNYDRTPVRYRLYYVGGPGEVMDTVSGWSDTPFEGETGRITGNIVSNVDGSGLPDILICADGLQTLTDSNGDFVLDGLTAGIHNLVAYALDGRYQPFQQGAKIQAGKRTPVNIRMTQSEMVNVVFTISVPANTGPSAPIRLAGNLYQLGNSFGDLKGGVSSVADRMPVFTPMLDGRFTLSLMLPAGADIRYKYTMGDGFWNAEHQSGGNFVLRQLIVPASGGIVQEVIETWQSGPSAPILFEVTTPANTPVTDIVSIQFNPYGWTEPIHMWKLSNNHWVYQLFSPLNMLGSFEYRYCRNDQCGSADDSATAGNDMGRLVSTSLTAQDIQDTISSWQWLSDNVSVDTTGMNVQPRQPGFSAGVELQADYEPSWQMWMSQAMQNIQTMGSNLVVVSPTWTIKGESPLVFEQVPGEDPLGVEISDTVSRAQALNLNVAIFPQVHLPASADKWWTEARRDPEWWNAWFNRYRAFALYFADLATKNGVQTLVLGDDWMEPAYSGGTLTDGSSSNPPADAETRWSSLVAEIRQRFTGQLYWAVSYPGGLANAPGLIFEVDGIYLLWYAPLSITDQTDLEGMQAEAGMFLDSEIEPFQSVFQKPLIVSVAYPSINGTARACIPNNEGGCLEWSLLNQPISDPVSFDINLQAQSDAYLAVLNAVNDRSWISGFISRGYYPPAALQDPSASIHGKTSEALLSYWYSRWLGIVQ